MLDDRNRPFGILKAPLSTKPVPSKRWLNQINGNKKKPNMNNSLKEEKILSRCSLIPTYHALKIQTKISYNNVNMTHKKQDLGINAYKSNLTNKSKRYKEHTE